MGPAGNKLPTRKRSQVPRYLTEYSSSSSSSSSQEPQHPSTRQPLHLLPGVALAHALLPLQLQLSGACPSRSHIGGNGSLRLLSFPAPLPSSQPLPLPPVLGEAGLDPTTKERTSKGPHQVSHMCIAPSQRPETQTFLPCALIASHHTARATPTHTRQFVHTTLDTTYPHLVKSLRPAHCCIHIDIAIHIHTHTHRPHNHTYSTSNTQAYAACIYAHHT